MTNGLTSPKAAEGPPGRAPDAARGAPPPNDAFAGILGDAQQARTAVAEGQSQDKPTTADDSAKPATDAPAEAPAPADAPAPDASATVVAAVLAALPQPVQVPPPTVAADAPVAEQATPVVQVEAPAVVPGVPTPVAAPEVAEQSVALPVTTEAPVALPQASVAQVQIATAKPDAAVQVAAPQQAAPGAPKPQAPQAVASPAPAQPVVAGATPQPTAQQQQQQPQEQPLPQPAPQQPAAQAPGQPAPAAPTTPTAPTAAPAPAAGPSAATATATATPIPLARAAEAVEHVLRVVATRGGVTHARIALQPDSLGSVDVHIRSTAEGLVARVVAHTAEAVQTLQHAANDLRQSLEEQGLTLMSLDIGQPGERRAGGRAHESADQTPESDQAASADTEISSTQTLRLPTGVLVDVLA